MNNKEDDRLKEIVKKYLEGPQGGPPPYTNSYLLQNMAHLGEKDMKDFKDFDELDRRTRTIKQSTYNNIKYEIAGYESTNAFGMACAYVYLTHEQYQILLACLLDGAVHDFSSYKRYEELQIPGVHGGFTFGATITTEDLTTGENGEVRTAHSLIKLGWGYCHYDNSLFTPMDDIQKDIETAIDFIQEAMYKKVKEEQEKEKGLMDAIGEINKMIEESEKNSAVRKNKNNEIIKKFIIDYAETWMVDPSVDWLQNKPELISELINKLTKTMEEALIHTILKEWKKS